MGALVFPFGWVGGPRRVIHYVGGAWCRGGELHRACSVRDFCARCCLPCDSLPPVSRVGPAIPTLTGVVCGVWAAGLRVGRVRVLAWLVPTWAFTIARRGSVLIARILRAWFHFSVFTQLV